MTEIQVQFRSLVELLLYRAATQPDDRAYAFVTERGKESDTLTFRELDQRARAVAGVLRRLASRGDRALLAFAPGLEFLVAYFACLYVGVVPVPIMPPRRHRLKQSTSAITNDCLPVVALTSMRTLDVIRPQFVDLPNCSEMPLLTVDGRTEFAGEGFEPNVPIPDDLAFLQYTSGSTSDPKGVMISHGNLLANFEMIKQAYGHDRFSTYVSWVPYYHDMGLILNILQSLYLGTLCVLIPPLLFAQRPWLWLQVIHDYRAKVSAAPNFAFDLCVSAFRSDEMTGLDLTCWKVAINGAETVRAATLARFANTFEPYGFTTCAINPSYGMAEATVLISAGSPEKPPVIRHISKNGLLLNHVIAPRSEHDTYEIVGCGRILQNERVVIANPQTRRQCESNEIGEIWVAGPHVAGGYWQNPKASQETFKAFLADTGDGPFLRTGDLGFLSEGGLFITGRIKDVIIIRGGNFYPQDIEQIVGKCDVAFRQNCCAAFVVSDDQLVVVQEIERSYRQRFDERHLASCVRKEVVVEFDLMVHTVVFVKPGSVPKTSSGKIQRGVARQRYLEGSLDIWGIDEVAISGEGNRSEQPHEISMTP